MAALDRVPVRTAQWKAIPAIICNTTKGYGAFSDFLNKHKVTTHDHLIEQEVELQQRRRGLRVQAAQESFPSGRRTHSNSESNFSMQHCTCISILN